MNKTIGFLHQKFPFGGAETATIRLARELTKHGYTIYIFCTEFYPALSKNHDLLYKVEVLPDSLRINSANNIARLTTRIQEYGISNLCVSCNTFLPAMRQLYEMTGLRLVYIQHGQPFWEKQSHLDASAKHGFMKFKVAYVNNAKEKLWHHYSRRYKQVYADLYNHCHVYVNLHPRYSWEIQQAIHCDGKKFANIPNMVMPFEGDNHGKKKQILYSGRMSRIDKRVDRLLLVWSMLQNRFPDWELVLVGDGLERPRLEAMVQENRLERVRFEGWRKDMKRYYEEASIVCLTSTFESFGLCLTEGMAAGCIPVAFNCSAGVADIVNECGMLVPPFQTKAYARALSCLMEDESLRRSKQEACAESVKRFYPSQVLPQWIDIFERDT